MALMKIRGKLPTMRKNAFVTIAWKSKKAGKDGIIIEGIVKDSIGDTIKVEWVSARFWFLRVHRTKWFSFKDENYSINVKE